jgi:hypothetical protein
LPIVILIKVRPMTQLRWLHFCVQDVMISIALAAAIQTLTTRIPPFFPGSRGRETRAPE